MSATSPSTPGSGDRSGTRSGTVRRGAAVYLAGVVVILVVYAVATTVLWLNRGWDESGPLSFRSPAATDPLAGDLSVEEVVQRCASTDEVDDQEPVTVREAVVDGRSYYACYELRDGDVWEAVVIDDSGQKAPSQLIKDQGAWRWIGTVKTPGEIVLGGAAVLTVGILYFLYFRRWRPGPPVPARWWESTAGSAVLGATCVLPLTLPFRRGETPARRLRLFFLWLFGVIATVVAAFLFTGAADPLSSVVLALVATAQLFCWLAGRRLLAPAGFGSPTLRDGSPAQVASPYAVLPPPPPTATTSTTSTPSTTSPQEAAVAGRGRPPSRYRVQRAGDLPSFRDVGGMSMLKDELGDTLGLLLAFSHEAEQYRIRFNGILLHGPPGVGKTFMAQATAGEFGLNFLAISTGDLISKYVGESAGNIKEAFAEAARNVPCVLFFDEFDSIAERRDDGIGEESKRVVNQLLQSLEEWRATPDLVVMAATNHLDRLDSAVVRPGRFDRHVRVDLPDLQARMAVLRAQLAGRPLAEDVDVADVAERLAGRTPALISRVANAAALRAFRESTESGLPVAISAGMLRDAIAGLGGADRPTVEDWTWERLVLDTDTVGELKQVQILVKDPQLALRYGVQPPSGLLLAGPPGTGKTTIARVFAAQAGCSFYPQTAADLTSKWVGESEAGVVRLFARARENAPSIIFIDEIDAIASARSESGTSYLDRTLTQLLTELDGMTEQRGVFVMAATNRPDALDPALLRGGRLSRTIEVPLPDRDARRRLLELFSARMPLDRVDLDALAGRTEGMSGADLEALCQQAALTAMVAHQADPGQEQVVDARDFARALAELRPDATPDATPPEPEHHRPGGYL